MNVSRKSPIWMPVLFAPLLAMKILSSPAEDPGNKAQLQQKQRAESTAAFLKIIDRARVPLAPKLTEVGGIDGGKQFHFSFSSDSENRVPGILIEPADAAGKHPVVIVLHGTGSSKERQLPLLKELASRGFLSVAIDAPYHGERAPRGRSQYVQALLRAYMTRGEHPFVYDTVWDAMRLVDYLASRSDVDASKIGLIGFSKGGIETYLTAAVDPRIAVAVSCIGAQSFRWSLEHNAWQALVDTIKGGLDGQLSAVLHDSDPDLVRSFLDRVVPGIDDQFDAPAMLPLIAPRPLMLINSDSDPLTPLASVMECANAAKKAYAQSHAEDRFLLRIQEKTGHTVSAASRRAAIDWFAKWLTPAERRVTSDE